VREKYYIEELSEDLEKKYNDAVSELEIGKLDEAEEKLNELLEEKEEFVPAYNKLGVISFYRKDLEKAEEWLKKAEEFDEEFAPVITNFGSLAKKRGDKEKAKKLYKKAIEIDSDYGAAHNNLGVVLREEGDFSSSVKHLKKARKLGSYSVKITDEPFYKRKGCLVPVALVIFFTLLIYLWLS